MIPKAITQVAKHMLDAVGGSIKHLGEYQGKEAYCVFDGAQEPSSVLLYDGNEVDVIDGFEADLIVGVLFDEDTDGEKYIPAPDGYEDFYRHSKNDRVYWTAPIDTIGQICFSFDRKKIYNLFSDFPHRLSKADIDIFCEENPYWASFFENRLT